MAETTWVVDEEKFDLVDSLHRHMKMVAGLTRYFKRKAVKRPFDSAAELVEVRIKLMCHNSSLHVAAGWQQSDCCHPAATNPRIQ